MAVIERWNLFAKIRQDLYGFVDVLTVQYEKTLAIQTTSSSNSSARRKKIVEHENLPILISAGWEVVIHGWRKDAKGNGSCRRKLSFKLIFFRQLKIIK